MSIILPLLMGQLRERKNMGLFHSFFGGAQEIAGKNAAHDVGAHINQSCHEALKILLCFFFVKKKGEDQSDLQGKWHRAATFRWVEVAHVFSRRMATSGGRTRPHQPCTRLPLSPCWSATNPAWVFSLSAGLPRWPVCNTGLAQIHPLLRIRAGLPLSAGRASRWQP